MKAKPAADLSQSFHPYPKPAAKAKKTPGFIAKGKKTRNWENARVVLKKMFEAWEITRCEIKLEGCFNDDFLGFAHTERRNNLNQEDVRSPNKVVLACQSCHDKVDFRMDRKEAKLLLEGIIKKREYV